MRPETTRPPLGQSGGRFDFLAQDNSQSSTPSGQLDLRFAGATYEPECDAERLGGQLARVRGLMRDGRWRTLREITEAVGGSEAGVSARLRDLRKAKFGGHAVERRRRGDPRCGLFEYSLEVRR
jgi:hypothetical protein